MWPTFLLAAITRSLSLAGSAQPESLSRRKTSTGKAAEVEALIEPTLEGMGYRIVRTLMTGGQRHQARLQVMVERTDGHGMDVDACADASRAIEALLDERDPIEGTYDLEVSSPGIDRPLTRLADFETWAGFDARVEMAEAVAGRRRFKGRLMGVADEEIRIDVEGTLWALPFAEIEKAKLVLTDELIAATDTREGSGAN